MKDEELRRLFEEGISKPPFEKGLERFGEEGNWPGQYKDYAVQLAWEWFASGYRQALPKWIPVSEKMPDVERDPDWWEESDHVLATDGVHVYVACTRRMFPDEVDVKTRWIIVGRDGYEFEDVTHWMPLPKLPG